MMMCCLGLGMGCPTSPETSATGVLLGMALGVFLFFGGAGLPFPPLGLHRALRRWGRFAYSRPWPCLLWHVMMSQASQCPFLVTLFLLSGLPGQYMAEIGCVGLTLHLSE